MTPRDLTNTLSDMMTFGDATLTEHQEDVLYAAIRVLRDGGQVRLPGTGDTAPQPRSASELSPRSSDH